MSKNRTTGRTETPPFWFSVAIDAGENGRPTREPATRRMSAPLGRRRRRDIPRRALQRNARYFY